MIRLRVIQAERDSLLTALSDSKASLEAQLIQLADSSKTEDLDGDSIAANGSAEHEGVEDFGNGTTNSNLVEAGD